MLKLRPPRKETLLCASLCFACALISLGMVMIQDGGAFTLREDFDFQQLPFTMGLHNQIVRGGLAGWCWNLDLGASAVQGFGFYELGSPFFWVSMLFPSSAFPYVVGWIYILKYVVAGITAHLFLRRFVGNPRSATVGALLYAFSGFQTTNLLFYHFHDVVALFPLLLIGLERLMENRRDWAPFTLAVCINALTNYFFFVQSTLFLLLYFGFRFGPSLKREGRLAKSIARCFAFGLLGVAMAAALIVPSAIYMLTNPRAGGTALSLSNLVWDPWQLLFQLQGFLLPADVMHDHNAIIWQQWNSTSCWLPMVGVTLVVAYMRKERDWLTWLLVALLVICLCPLLTSAFTLFKSIYQRWWYLLVLTMALASTRVIDAPSAYDIRFATKACAIICVAFVAIVSVGSYALGIIEMFHPDRFYLYAAITLAGILATFAIMGKGSTQDVPRANTTALTCGVLIFATIPFMIALSLLRQDLLTGELLDNISSEEQAAGTLNELALGTQLKTLDPQYRYATGDNRLTLPGEAAGVSSFSSTVSVASGTFDELFGTPATNVWHLNKSTVPGLTELLGGRYHVTASPTDGDVVDQHNIGGITYYVESKDACPLGVMYDCYLSLEDITLLPKSKRAIALMQAPVVATDAVGNVDDFATRIRTTDLDLAKSESELSKIAQAHSVQDFWRNDYAFGFTCNASKSSLVYLAVPHDQGWSATVDGVETRIVDSAGMMILPVEAGNHRIEFRYETPGLSMGIVASVVAWIAFFVLKRLAR